MGNFAVTISRGYGSRGRQIGKKLAKRLNIDFVDRELLRLASEESGINEALFGQADERASRLSLLFRNFRRSRVGAPLSPEQDGFTSNENLFNFQADVLRSLIDRESFVVLGRAADFILRGRPNVLTVSIQAPHAFCVNEIQNRDGVSEKQAETLVNRVNRYRADFYEYYTGQPWNLPENYDLCLNTSSLGDENCIRLIIGAARLKLGPYFQPGPDAAFEEAAVERKQCR